MSTHPTEQITVYSDYVCPFCYLGRESLSRYQETRDEELEINWQPFDLRHGKRNPDGSIDHSVDDGKDESYYEQARQNVERLQAEYGVEEMLNLDEVPDVDSLNAQVASHYVAETHPDDWRAFDDAVLAALWVEGRDIGDVAVLVDIAENAGLDGDEIREAVADDDRRSELHDRFAEAQRRGVTGVPTFAYDGHAARGAVPPAHLERLVEGAND